MSRNKMRRLLRQRATRFDQLVFMNSLSINTHGWTRFGG